MGSLGLVGFVGSRSLGSAWAGLVSSVVAAFAGRPLAVSCGRGACALVRQAAPSARVFSVGQFPGLPPVAALVRRSVALVRAVAAGGGPLVAFIAGPCPAQVAPSSSPSRCFCGGGSGTWAELALAVGLGCPVIVFWCAASPPPPCSPAPSLPSWWGGAWSPVSVGGVAGWQFVPAQSQLPLW